MAIKKFLEILKNLLYNIIRVKGKENLKWKMKE